MVGIQKPLYTIPLNSNVPYPPRGEECNSLCTCHFDNSFLFYFPGHGIEAQ